MIEIKELRKAFGADEVLKGIDLSIAEKEVVVIIGPSGSGKSLTLQLLAGLLKPDGGHIRVNGGTWFDERINLPAQKRRVGLLFQDYALFPHLTVAQNIDFGLARGLSNPSKRPSEKARYWLEMLRLERVAGHYPQQISGGQKQRIAIAGAIAMQTSCLVLDEPTAMLDPRGRGEVLNAVKKLHDEQGMTIVYITHFMEEAIAADRIILMADGTVVMDGTPREIFSQTERVRELGLEIPLAADLAQRLRRGGYDLPKDILTDEELIYCLSK